MGQTLRVTVDNLTFDCHTAGNPNHELIVFLHGFPESSHMWINLMDKIATLGFYCVAPDQRGYSRDACPKGKENYKMKFLREDVINIVNSLGKNKFHLVGHDFGSAIGWSTIYNFKDRILSWTALSMPHNRAFSKALKSSREQRKMSNYFGLFLIPVVSEIIIRWNDFKLLRKVCKEVGAEGVEVYIKIFKQKGSLTASLNYYRANIGRNNNERVGDVDVPTLFIWGRNDTAIGRVAAEGCKDFVTGDYTFLELSGSHWLVQTNYNEVEEAIVKHITRFKVS